MKISKKNPVNKLKQEDNNLSEQGQVLILVVLVMLILTMAILFMFDLQTVIRGKMKLETGEQAAALTAAKWQKESLNLIGELNLIKACTMLTDGTVPYIPADDRLPLEEQRELEAASASRCITEMQARISFIGPLIGLGAAQQAAKNNGMAVNSGLAGEMDQYIQKLAIDPRYTEEVAEYIPSSGQGGYQWRESYISMLTAIMTQGLAIRPNGRFPGLEGVDPRWLTNESLYAAINHSLWCNSTLNMLVQFPDTYWSGKWWNIEFSNTSFPNESEIYTLRIQYTPARNSRPYTYDLAENDISILASDRGMTSESSWDILRNVTWCTYDSSWYQDSANYNGPDTSVWSRRNYLRTNLKNSFLYGGPLAYAEGYQDLTMLNRYATTMERPDNTTADQRSKAQRALQRNAVRDRGTQSVRVGNNIIEDLQPGGALAKIIGAADDLPPSTTGIILPLFTDVALVPSTLQAYRPMRGSFTLLERFLIWLSDVNDLHNPESPPPAGTESYLSALQLIDTASFRKTGYNHDFDHTTISSDREYFTDDYKYNEHTNPTGAGWLQEAYILDDLNYDPDNPTDDIIEANDGWNITYAYQGKMIIRDRRGNIIINNQAVCNWMPGGPGPGPPPRIRRGPPRL